MFFKIIKSISFFLICLLVFTGCSSSNLNSAGIEKNTSLDSTNSKIKIVTSFYPIYISTINITKNIPNLSVVNMTKPQTGCLHDYQLTPEDIKTLETAKIFIINGADMESFMDKAIKSQPHVKIINASKGIDLIKNQNDGEDNPHVWVSISYVVQQVKNIKTQLSELDPSNAEKYKANADEYISKLEAQKNKMHLALDELKNRDIITFHEAFPYFAKEFRLNIVSIIEREPGSEPSAAEIAKTIKIVKEKKVKALFAEPQYPAKAAETIAKETGAKLYKLDPAVTGPMDLDAYINIMDNNLKVLKEALE